MNFDRRQTGDLAGELARRYPRDGAVEIAVFPPSVYLLTAREALGSSGVGLGAQNMYHQPPGAYTGEICASMLEDCGCQYVILGHSERRSWLGETDVDINARARAALQAGLKPVICVGETLEQREAGQTNDVVKGQFDGSLAGIPPDAIDSVVIAYEPVWAIGTGRVATGEQAQEVHADLRKMLENGYNSSLASQVRILYGGSVKPDNARQLLDQPDIDGALVGGASLDAESFSAIIAAAEACSAS